MYLKILRKQVSSKKAFTLIEVIATLVLVGIIAVGTGIGIIKIADGYIFAKLNAETTQKSQVAIARILKELNAATAITTAAGNTIAYTRPAAPGSATIFNNVLNYSGNTISIAVNGAAAATLIGNITTFTATYRDSSGAVTAVPANIRRVDFSFTITGADNTAIEFGDVSDPVATVFLNEFI